MRVSQWLRFTGADYTIPRVTAGMHEAMWFLFGADDAPLWD